MLEARNLLLSNDACWPPVPNGCTHCRSLFFCQQAAMVAKRKGGVHSTFSTSFMTTIDGGVAATSDHFVSLQIASTVLL